MKIIYVIMLCVNMVGNVKLMLVEVIILSFGVIVGLDF